LRQIPYLAEKQGEWKMAHTELSLRERRAIEDMLNAKVPVSEIAVEIGRHRSTVYREIKRMSVTSPDFIVVQSFQAMMKRL
jgi:IS30 family transposase